MSGRACSACHGNFISSLLAVSGFADNKVRGRALLTPENEELLEKAQEVVIQAQKTLYINDDDKNRSDLSNFTLVEDAKKDDEVLAKKGDTLNDQL